MVSAASRNCSALASLPAIVLSLHLRSLGVIGCSWIWRCGAARAGSRRALCRHGLHLPAPVLPRGLAALARRTRGPWCHCLSMPCRSFGALRAARATPARPGHSVRASRRGGPDRSVVWRRRGRLIRTARRGWGLLPAVDCFAQSSEDL